MNELEHLRDRLAQLEAENAALRDDLAKNAIYYKPAAELEKLRADLAALQDVVTAERREREHTQQVRDETLKNLSVTQADLARARAVLDSAEVDPPDDDSGIRVWLDPAAWTAWQARNSE